jgi:hypothetical protein
MKAAAWPLPEQEPVMRRLCLVLIALLLLASSGVPAAWAAGPAGSARAHGAADRTILDFKALFGQLSEVFFKVFATVDTGPVIDPWGRTTVDEGPRIDPLGGVTTDEGPVIDPWG